MKNETLRDYLEVYGREREVVVDLGDQGLKDWGLRGLVNIRCEIKSVRLEGERVIIELGEAVQEVK